MAVTPKAITEIPTIDVVMVVVETATKSYALDTASQIGVEPQIEEEDAVKLVIKGKLKAQKPAVSTITGNQITLTDNVFAPELVKILQGGTIKYWTSAEKTAEGTEETAFGVSSYTPPTVGSGEKGEVFKLHAYSAQYDASGQIVQYEQITYPNCQGVPVAFGSEDGAFRAPEYTINSAPKKDESPYEIHYVQTLPSVS
jgi:hypothetical protein